MSKLELKKIWDPVTRIWHWVLALAVIINWVFGEFMTFDTIGWHFYLGYTVLALLLLRLLWGFFGPDPIRWRTLLLGLGNLKHYLLNLHRRQPSGTAGHNPLGTLSIFALLIILGGQTLTGLFIESEDFFESGPLAGYVSDATSYSLTWWHHFLAKILLLLIAIHLAAIIFYWLWKRENLIKPMITGWKWVKPDISQDDKSS